jgi:ribonuclease R
MKTGKVVYKSGRLWVDQYNIAKNQVLYPVILDGDHVTYHVLNKMAIVDSVDEHSTFCTLGIVTGRNMLSLPLCSPVFSTNLFNAGLFYPSGTRVIVHVSPHNIKIAEEMGHMNNRLMDEKIIRRIYQTEVQVKLDTQNIESNESYQPIISPEVKRLDETMLDTYTIDPPESMDFDDAISVDLDNQRIYTHIVDIHSQLPMNSSEDRAARRLGFTLYLPERVTHLLPQHLASEAFSLVQHQPRQVVTTMFQFHEGKLASVQCYPSTIVVKHRINYGILLSQIEDKDPKWNWVLEVITPYRKPSIDIPKLVVTIDNGVIQNYRSESNVDDAHKLVETLMVMTNSYIAKRLDQSIDDTIQKFSIQRYHPESVVGKTRETEDSFINNLLKLKTFKTAIYSSEKTGHFALNLEHYTHFTSPIRRYADVLVHRLLHGVIYSEEDFKRISEHLTYRERVVDKLCKQYMDWKIIDHISHHKMLTPIVSKVISVSPAGVVVLLGDLLFEVFIHVSKIYQGIRWIINKNMNMLESTNIVPMRIVRVGDNVKVYVHHADIVECKIDAIIMP